MANQFETSFIPQQPILKVEGKLRSSEPVNLALILALILFFVTIAVSVGAYLYRVQVDKRVNEKSQILQAAEKDFNMDEITTYKRIDSRLSLSKKLVDEHMISSVAFDLLESSTAQNIGLTSLAFTKDVRGNNIELAGQAPSYAAVYFQAESWRAMRPKIRNVEVSGMALSEETGIVSFSMKLMIDPQYFESLRVLNAQSTSPQTGATSKNLETVSSTTTKTANISTP
jgi:hypothetical protein